MAPTDDRAPWTGRRFCVVAAAVLLLACGRSAGTDTNATAMRTQQVFEACSQDMLRSTCRFSNDKSSNTTPAASSVFVAGVGQVDAVAYKSLREAGDAMCGQVRRSCTENWAGPACRTARSLWMN